MALTSVRSLSEQADHLTSQNNGANPVSPPAVAPQSPLYEILICDIATSLPPQLAQHLASKPTMSDIHDWLAVAALYRWVSDDKVVAQHFLTEVGDNPKNASLALARALAARMEPPVRDAQWYRCDRIGLILQLLTLSVLLICRGALLLYVNSLGVVNLFSLDGIFPGTVHTHLTGGETPTSTFFIILLGCTVLWLGFEAHSMPAFLEYLRQLPAARRGLPVPLSWRTDTFYACWRLHLLALLLYVSFHGWSLLTHVTGLADAWSSQWLATKVVQGLMIVVTAGVVQSFRSAFLLGSRPVHS